MNESTIISLFLTDLTTNSPHQTKAMKLKNKENFSPRRTYQKFATPTFTKKISSKVNSFQCDFDDQMINQNIGINAILSVSSPHGTSKQIFCHDDEPNEDEEMEMISNSIKCQGLREIDNKENKQNIQSPLLSEKEKNKTVSKSGKKSINRYEGKENQKKKLRLRKKKKSAEKEASYDKGLETSSLTERVKEEIQAALTERIPVAKNLQKNIEEYICKKEKKLRQLRVEQEVKTMRECTFTPTTNKNNSTTPRRKFQDFLESQEAFSTKVELKKQQIKVRQEQLQKSQESFRPAINKCNKQKKKQKPAYQRLYELKDQKKNYQTLEQNIEDKPKNLGKENMVQKNNTKKNAEFHTKASNGLSVSSNARKTPVGELLYEDAMRRSNFKKTVVKNHLTSSSMFTSHMESENMSKSPRKTNKKNEKFVTQKLIKEYCFALEKFQLLPKFLFNSEESSEEKVDALEFTHGEYFHKKSLNAASKDTEEIAIMEEVSLKDFQNILRELGFLLYLEDDDCELAYRQKSLAYEAYELLQEYGVNIKNICILLLAFIGIFSVDPLNFGSEEHFDENSTGENFQLNEKEGRKIQKYFDLLHCNRLTSFQKSKSDKIQEIPAARSSSKDRHKEYTEQLASKYRQKMIEKTNQRFLSNKIDVVIPENNVLTHEDMLVINQIGKNLSIEKERKKMKLNELDEECTFQPKINKKRQREQGNEMHAYLRSSEELKRSKGMNKSKELYQYAKNRKKMLEEQMKIRQSQEEQSLMIESKSVKKSNKVENNRCSPFPRAKDVDKTIARMHEARKKREEKEEFLKKGWHLNEKKSTQIGKKAHHYKSQNNLEENQAILSWRPITDRSPPKEQDTSQREDRKTNKNYLSNESQQCMGEIESATERSKQPFLMIDVNMEDQTHQIEFYTGDQQKLEEIVNEFCRKHDLDEVSKQQLLGLVVAEISIFLNEVGVESTATEV